jgi:hypothetical protein
MRRLAAAVLAVLAIAASAFAADVNGKWVGSVDTPNGPLELTYEFKADGETLTGSVTSAMGTVALSNGKIAGEKMTYDVEIDTGKITHEATVNADGTEITVRATGDWGTAEYVVKKVVAP